MVEQIQNKCTDLFKRYTLEKPEIKECYIAYLDMLGYKAFFEETPDKIGGMLSVFTQAVEKMVERLQFFNIAFQFNTNINDIYKIKIFSDNVLLWMEYKQSYETKLLLLAFLEMVKDFQINLICSYGIFLRGGVIKGDFAVNDVFVFGKGLIDVVDLESRKAIFPRIIVDESVVKDLNNTVTCRGSAACNVCKGLSQIEGLFQNNTSNELFDRISRAYWIYDDILSAAPSEYYNMNQISKVRGMLRERADVAKAAMSIKPEFLEIEYRNVKSLIPKMTEIFNNVLSCQINEYEKICNTMMNSCFFKDDDEIAVLDYINIPDMLRLFASDLIDETVNKIKELFENQEDLVEEIDILIDQSKKQEHISRTIGVHKHRIESEIKERMLYYEKNKGNKDKLRANEKVLKKYLWSIKYHNRICETNGKIDLKIIYDVSFEPIDDLLFVHIRQMQDSIINEGVE